MIKDCEYISHLYEFKEVILRRVYESALFLSCPFNIRHVEENCKPNKVELCFM